VKPAERGISQMMVDLYQSFRAPLTDETPFNWHAMLLGGDIRRYRTHSDPMQVVSGADYRRTVHFEAPPSNHVPNEMKRFIAWFNDTAPIGRTPLSALTRAGIGHLYFESIHPFEDGNGRIAGRSRKNPWRKISDGRVWSRSPLPSSANARTTTPR
jgi:Fic family protein